MTECKHGLRHGCSYCHATIKMTAPARTPIPKKRARTTSLSEKMNDRMTALNKRLRELRGQ